jgi:AraC-like DNA-binding protein
MRTTLVEHRIDIAPPSVCVDGTVVIIEREMRFFAVAGPLQKPVRHNHFNMHLVVPLTGNVVVTTEHDGVRAYSEPFLVAANVGHSLDAVQGTLALILIVAPFSNFGVACRGVLGSRDTETFRDRSTVSLIALFRGLCNGVIDQDSCIDAIASMCWSIVDDPFSIDEETIDNRLVRALSILMNQDSLTLNADDVARRIALSKSRFLHLLHDQLGITFRRFQIWLRLVRSFNEFPQWSTLTDVAHAAGFSDAAHYSRLFKETFGVTPSTFFYNSTIILQSGAE